MKTIVINWTTKFPLTSDAFTEKDLTQLPDRQNVLYQIYGHSPIYGENVLLYIGITKDSTRRMGQHLNSIFGRGINLSVSIGELNEPEENNLEIAEAILINLHKPSFNKEFLHDIPDIAKTPDELILILNKGNRGALMLECSNIWWQNKV